MCTPFEKKDAGTVYDQLVVPVANAYGRPSIETSTFCTVEAESDEVPVNVIDGVEIVEPLTGDVIDTTGRVHGILLTGVPETVPKL